MNIRIKLITSYFLLCASISIYAQTSSVKTTKTIKTKNGAYYFNIQSFVDNKLLVVDKKDFKYLLFDSELNNISSIDIKFPKTKYSSKLKMLDVYEYKNKRSLISYYVNPAKKTCYFFSNRINDSGIVESNFSKIHEYSTPSNKYNIVVEYSNDSSKIMILTYDILYSLKEKKIDIAVLDNNFNIIWKKIYTSPYNDDEFKKIDYKINNDGKAYIIGSLKNKSKEKNAPNNLISVISFESTLDEAKVTTINDDFEIRKILASIDLTNNLHIIGAYTTSSRFRFSGLKNIVIDSKSNEIIKYNNIEMPAYFQNDKREKTDENLGISDFNLLKILYKKNGGYYVLAEKSYKNESVAVGPYGGGGGKIYRNENTFIFNFDFDNSNLWAIQIPKSQNTKNDLGRYNSFYAYEKDDNLYTLHNDHSDNSLNASSNVKRKTLKKSLDAILVCSEIKPDGTLTQKTLASEKEKKIAFIPNSVKIVNNRIFIFGEKMKAGSKYLEYTLGEIINP